MYNIYSDEHSESVANSPGVDEHEATHPMTWKEFKECIDEIAKDDTPIRMIEIWLPVNGEYMSIRFDEQGFLSVEDV